MSEIIYRGKVINLRLDTIPLEDGRTVRLEIVEHAAIRPMLAKLVGIDAHVALEIEGERVPAAFEAGRSDEDRISSVQYVRFRPGDAARAALGRPGARCAIVCDLPGYQHRATLTEDARESLAGDLRAGD